MCELHNEWDRYKITNTHRYTLYTNIHHALETNTKRSILLLKEEEKKISKIILRL